jgi:peptidoglycan hydrolase-like protein with peptidoglycan-binding domain
MRILHVTSPMMFGPDVVSLQNALFKQGFAPGPLDGRYGSTTSAAVIDYQKAHGIPVTGIVDEVTQKLLFSEPKSPPEPRPLSPKGLAALFEAVKHLGTKEDPSGSNQTPFGEWYGINGVPWCNIFVSYCFALNFSPVILCEGFKGAGVQPGKGCAYVPTTEAWLKATGQWVGRTRAFPGDIVIYNWGGQESEHIGIVESWGGGDGNPSGSFIAIEGNTSMGNDSDGGEVMRRTRRLSQVSGFGRIG